MERDDLAPLAGFFADAQALAPGASIALGEDAAHHMRVRRLGVGEQVYVADGLGTQGRGRIVRLSKSAATVELGEVAHFERLPAIHLLLPIADRERMLWLAEKATELGVTSWRPVLWRRSRSVSPRGEGPSFGGKVRARMISALLQSASPWLPDAHPDAPPERALAAAPVGGSRVLLDRGGEPMLRTPLEPPVVIAVGPEGGFDAGERASFGASGFRIVSLNANILRFETAAVAAIAIARAALGATQRGNRDHG